MAITVRSGGEDRTITGCTVRVGGINRTIKTIQVQDRGVLRTVATFVSDLSAEADPTQVFGTITGDGVATTSQVTITPQGGQAPFTYAWVPTDGATGSVTSPTSAQTTFSRFVNEGESVDEVFRCTVTDNLSNSVEVDVTATFSSADLGGLS